MKASTAASNRTGKPRGRPFTSGDPRGKPYQPGESGNPGGRPQGLPALVRHYTDDYGDLVRYLAMIAHGVTPPVVDLRTRREVRKSQAATVSLRERMEAIRELLDRGAGRPEQMAVIRSQEDAVCVLALIDRIALELFGPDGREKLEERLREAVAAGELDN